MPRLRPVPACASVCGAAIITIVQVVKYAPGYVYGWSNRANVLIAEGDLHGAVADYDRALELADGLTMSDKWVIYLNRRVVEDFIALIESVFVHIYLGRDTRGGGLGVHELDVDGVRVCDRPSGWVLCCARHPTQKHR